jgi:6,7-dimethyl-8-ribityllumazine synthase
MTHTNIPPLSLELSDYKVLANDTLPTTAIQIGIAVSQFNDGITSRLLSGALSVLSAHSISPNHITISYVFGAFELPIMAQRLLHDGCDAVIGLGCIMRGETAHFDYVASACAQGIMSVALAEKKPVIFGVLTTDTPEQALARCDDSPNNKGHESATALIQLLKNLAR